MDATVEQGLRWSRFVYRLGVTADDDKTSHVAILGPGEYYNSHIAVCDMQLLVEVSEPVHEFELLSRHSRRKLEADLVDGGLTLCAVCVAELESYVERRRAENRAP